MCSSSYAEVARVRFSWVLSSVQSGDLAWVESNQQRKGLTAYGLERLCWCEEQSSLAKDHTPLAYSHRLAPFIPNFGRFWVFRVADSVDTLILCCLLGRCREVEHAFRK